MTCERAKEKVRGFPRERTFSKKGIPARRFSSGRVGRNRIERKSTRASDEGRSARGAKTARQGWCREEEGGRAETWTDGSTPLAQIPLDGEELPCRPLVGALAEAAERPSDLEPGPDPSLLGLASGELVLLGPGLGGRERNAPAGRGGRGGGTRSVERRFSLDDVRADLEPRAELNVDLCVGEERGRTQGGGRGAVGGSGPSFRKRRAGKGERG